MMDSQQPPAPSARDSVALACILEFHAAGLDIQRARSAIDEFSGVIDGILFDIERHLQDPRNAWLTVINFADAGWGWASGTEDADTFGGGKVISKVSINMIAVWQKMPDHLVLPKLNEKVEPAILPFTDS